MAPMHDSLTIPARFCGPPTSGNGGFSAGLLAAFVGGTVEVTLHRPPPLERPLHVDVAPDGEGAVLRDGDEVVARAVPTTVTLDVPEPVSVGVAVVAAESSHFRQAPGEHPFPTCFVCGPDRTEGDGLRLFPGQVTGTDIFAVPWSPAAEFADDTGNVRNEIVWAALDCPSSFAMYIASDPLEGTYVLGRLAVRIDERPKTGNDYVIVSWRIGVDGRKLFAGSALFDARGDLHAVGRATWIRV
jgi:hypothetical protein